MPPRPDAYRQFRDHLDASAPFESLEAALSVLEGAVDNDSNSPLTFLGELMRFESGISTSDCRSILWLNFEFLTSEVMERYKELRMRPFAIAASDVEYVNALHLPFRSRGWEEVTHDWLTLTDVIAHFEKEIGQHLEFCILIPNDDVAPAIYEQMEWYESERMLLLYCAGGQYFAKYQSATKPIEISSLRGNFGEKRIEHFIEWLVKFHGLAQKNVDLYLGCTPSVYTGLRGLRVWSAMTGNVGYQHLSWVKDIAHLFQMELFPSLQSSLATGSLDRFWEKTAEATHSSIQYGDQDHYLRIFLGMKPEEPWPGDLTSSDVREMLKSLCGEMAAFHGGDRPLVALGVVFLLLGAVAKRRIGGIRELRGRLEVSDPSGLSRNVRAFPPQNSELAKRTALELFKLFTLIATNEQTGDLGIQQVRATPNVIEIDTSILAFSSRAGHVSLMNGLRLALQEGNFHQVGQVAETIKACMKLLMSSDVLAEDCRTSRDVPAFLISGLEVDVRDGKYLGLRVKVWTPP